MSALLDHLARWKPFDVIVVGDFMLDELVYGNADRLSPEAPVPVLHVRKREDRPGGAANVCLDLAAMGGRVKAFGVVGDDLAGARLRELLHAAGVDVAGLITDEARPTTVKQSLIGLAQHRHPQKMFRVDTEEKRPLGESVAARLLEQFDAALAALGPEGVVCIEDYGKGVCTDGPRGTCRGVIERCRAARGGAGVPVLVDPAYTDGFERYAGATCLKPNRREALRATGVTLSDEARPIDYITPSTLLLEKLKLEAVVITLDRQGALVQERGRPAQIVPTVVRQVYDVTGAGDMVLAGLAAARANGLAWPEAVRLANIAAGLEVESFGVTPIPIEQIHRSALLLEGGLNGRGKLRTLEELLVEVAALRQEQNGGAKKNVVFTNGCFDILHAGHLSLLKRAAEHGDFLIVAVNSDDSVRRLNKGPDRPMNNQHDRAQMLGGLECVGAVVIFDEDTPERLIEAIRPDVLVKGAEYAVEQVPGAKFVMENGGRVELLQMVEGRSTTGLVKKIRGG